MLELQRRTASLHPLIIVAAYAGAFASGYLSTPYISFPPFGILIVFELLVIWWLWSLYSICRAATPPMPVLGKIAFVLAVIGHIALLTAADLAYLPVAALAFIACNWLTADALVKAETRKPWLLWWDAFPTFLAVLYLPIGIWFLRPRIARLLAAA